MLNVVFSAVPPFLPEMVSFVVGLVLVGRLSPSDSPLLLMILVLVDIFVFVMKCTKFYFTIYFMLQGC